MKTCYTCKENKTLDCYHKNKSKSDGFDIICKDCRSVRAKKYYETGKTKVRLPHGMKKCNDCNVVKSVDEFNKRGENGRRPNCKVCQSIQGKKEEIKYADKIRKRKQDYYLKNKTYINRRSADYNLYKYKTDKMFRIKNHIRKRVSSLINIKRFNKNNNFSKYVGCSLDELKLHLQKQFKPGMTWENYGTNGWSIDHIIPLSSAETIEQLYELNHYTNLQPLWALENKQKSNKIIK